MDFGVIARIGQDVRRCRIKNIERADRQLCVAVGQVKAVAVLKVERGMAFDQAIGILVVAIAANEARGGAGRLVVQSPD